MDTALLSLALTLLGSSYNDRATHIAATAAHVAATSETRLASETATARLLVTMVVKESAGVETAIGDSGEAYGVAQIHWRVWLPFLESKGFDLYALFDMELSMRAMLAILDEQRARCGSLRRAMYAYASGHCKGTAVARPKMDARCAISKAC